MPLSANALAVALTVVSSAASAIGKAKQKAATRGLPALGGGGSGGGGAGGPGRSVLREYLRSPAWVGGLLLDVVGGIFIMVAYSLAPVSLVQPVSGIGLVILAIYSHFALGERMSGRQWVAAGAAAAGTALLGATSGGGGGGVGGEGAPPHPPPAPPPDAARAVLGLAAAAFLVLAAPRLTRKLRRRGASGSGGPSRRAKAGGRSVPAAQPGAATPRYGLRARSASFTGGGATPPPGDGVDAASIAGLAGRAGACYGLAAAACRAGFSLPPLSGGAGPASASAAAAAGVAASIALSAAGTALQTAALKPGNPVVVVTLSAVAAMVTGVAAGVAALGEAGRPAGRPARLLQIAAWVLTLGGVTVLAGSSGGGGGGGGDGWEGVDAVGGGGGGGGAGSSLRAGAAAALDAALPPAVRARLPTGLAQELRRAASLARGPGAHCHNV